MMIIIIIIMIILIIIIVGALGGVTRKLGNWVAKLGITLRTAKECTIGNSKDSEKGPCYLI